MGTAPTYREDKLAELMLYIAAKCQPHPAFGATKLNKALFYSDFLAYQAWRQPITGAEYRRRQFGPAPTRFLPVQRLLEESRAAVLQGKVLASGRTQKRLIPLRPANLKLFSSDEISLVDSVIDGLKELTADQVSDLSHDFLGWAFAAQGEVIPYYTVLLADSVPPLSEGDAVWVKTVAHRVSPQVA